jgi:hypothetical protein
MKKKKSREDFWLILGVLNLLAMAYPISCFLRAESTEDQIVAVFVLGGVGLLLAIIDTVGIVTAYSQ